MANTNEQPPSHVSLSIPSEQPPPSTSDNFQFMSDTFTLPQDDQASSSSPTQTSQGYAG